MASVSRKSQAEIDEADNLAEIEAARIDPDDMGCGQRCFFTYGQMCGRASELFNCCLTDYEEAMQKERRWEETVRLKERVLKQRDHLVRLEKEQKQLTDRMTAFQTDTTELIEETGENVRKELKKAFRMEVDISTKELMRKHERLAKEQNSMAETIEEHEEKLGELSTRTDKIKRELNETFVQLQEVDEELKAHKDSTATKFVRTDERITDETQQIHRKMDEAGNKIHEGKVRIDEQENINNEQNMDLARVKKALELLRKGQQEEKKSDVGGMGLPMAPPSIGFGKEGPEGGIAGKMKMFMHKEPEELSEMSLPSVPDEEPKERPPYYEFMVHTPSDVETPSEYNIRMDKNEAIANEKVAEARTEKRKLKKRAKRKKLAEAEKVLKKKTTKVAASGGGGASLPAHVTNA